MNIEHIAQICHEANKTYCLTIGDNSQLAWEEAPKWQQESAIKGVEFIIENPHVSTKAIHDAWLAEKARDGWKYGHSKNLERKEHPCFMQYEDLPQEQKVKDALFKAVVLALVIPAVDHD